MKYKIFIIIFFVSLKNYSQKLTYAPLYPKEGDEVTIKYKASLSPFKKTDNFFAIAKFYPKETKTYIKKGSDYWRGAVAIEQEVILTKEGTNYSGRFTIPKGSAVVLISFRNEKQFVTPGSDVTEINNKPYHINTYTTNTKISSGARFAVACYNFFLNGQSQDSAYCRNLLDEELHENRAFTKSIIQAFSDFYLLLNKEKKETIIALVNEIKKNGLRNETIYQNIIGTYLRCEIPDSAKAMDALMKQQFPEGNWKKNKAKSVFRTFEGKPSLYEQYLYSFHKTYPPINAEDSAFYYTNLCNLAMNLVGDTTVPQKERFYTIMKQVPESYNKYVSYYTLATDIFEQTKEVDFPASLVLECIKMFEKQLIKTTWKPDAIMSNKSWLKDIEATYFLFLNKYATMLSKKNDFTTAYVYLKDVYRKTSKSWRFLNGTYALYEEKNTVKNKALAAELKSMIIRDCYDNNVKDVYKRLLIKEGKTEAEAKELILKIEPFNETAFKADLKSTILNIPVKEFSLKNLNGEEVNIKNYVGKVIILDFWASWCGPCREAFPAMQALLNKYKADSNVVFLFINTAENISDEVERKKIVTNIIAEKKYSFNVLLDEKDKVSGLFEIKAFPTKLIIGKDGMLKYKDVGGGSNEKELLSKMTIMIDSLL